MVWQRFRSWLVVAKPGDEFAYHNGLLALDREKSREVDRMAGDALLAEQWGLVHLYQRRLPYTHIVQKGPVEGGCLYVARRTGRRIPMGVQA